MAGGGFVELNEKIRTLRSNRGWTQRELAEKLYVSEDAVSSWERGINTPPLDMAKNLAEVFDTSLETLTDDAVCIPVIHEVEGIPSDELRTDVVFPQGKQDDDHILCDAELRKGAVLHRFKNPAGVLYSAIYIGTHEIYSCERAHEQQMINYWNEE